MHEDPGCPGPPFYFGTLVAVVPPIMLVPRHVWKACVRGARCERIDALDLPKRALYNLRNSDSATSRRGTDSKRQQATLDL